MTKRQWRRIRGKIFLKFPAWSNRAKAKFRKVKFHPKCMVVLTKDFLYPCNTNIDFWYGTMES